MWYNEFKGGKYLMIISNLVPYSNSHTDEAILTADALRFFNAGVSFINTRLKVHLPLATNAQEDYTAIADHWQIQILGNYMSWGIKMQDGSLNEADRYYEMMLMGLSALENMMYGDNEDGSGGEIPYEFLDKKELANRFVKIDSTAFLPSWFTNDGR